MLGVMPSILLVLACPRADVCGDGIWSPLERCEVADPMFGAWCSDSCTWHVCGDGVLAPWEACEPSLDPTCDATCHLVACGNGLATPGEVCLDPSVPLTVGATPVEVVVTDVDGDGSLDIVTANAGETFVTVLTNVGGEAFVRTDVEVGVRPRSVQVVALDAVGRPDLLVASVDDQAVSVVLSAGAGWSPPTVYDVPGLASAAVALFPPPEQAGRVGDVFVAVPGEILRMSGNRVVQAGPALPDGSFESGAHFASVASGGSLHHWPTHQGLLRPDVVVWAGSEGELTGWLWEPGAPVVAYEESTDSGALDVAPLANDDLVVLLEARVVVEAGDGNYRRGDHAFPGGRSIAVGALDGLGDQDVAITDADGVGVMLGRELYGNGELAAHVPLLGAGDVATGDLNGDGVDEIVVAHPDGSQVTVVWSRP
ncbi:MAG: VCBS repeat-containing protein [Alphaproteobacteria bacterium]|nr:VCBS repeat-containing protein [Alphaproteobacteria bacterium]MCB9694209.1 VCBS repeat-containing protein [Alphaproteobacteria bacterium]